jgi:putative serine protease PepD
MKNAIKVAVLSSVISAALVYVILGLRPQQVQGGAPAFSIWPSATTPVAMSSPVTTAAAAPAPTSFSEDERNNIDIYKKDSPGVVFITATAVEFSPFQGPVQQAGTGSGAIIDNEGHIVTNHHVIELGLNRGGTLEVSLGDKKASYQAKVIGDDVSHDLAVLQIDAPRNRLTPIPLGTSKGLQVGQKVLAIGNPYGFDRTLTTGIISALGRSIQSEDDNGRSVHYFEDMIQTDAAINPGNSGGPLLNSAGEIIGINTMIYSPSGSNSGVGFAIPVDTIQRITKDLITLGYVRRTSIGLKSSFTFDQLANRLGEDTARTVMNANRGLAVIEVDPTGAAAQAGIRGYNREVIVRYWKIPVGGDVILAVDGREVNSTQELGVALDRHQAGDRVTVKVQRGTQMLDIPITLQEAPRTSR